MLPLQGARVRFLVGELGSHVPCGAAQKKKKKNWGGTRGPARALLCRQGRGHEDLGWGRGRVGNISFGAWALISPDMSLPRLPT